MARCKDCVYFNKIGEHSGQCRERPPEIVETTRYVCPEIKVPCSKTEWPTVNEDDWCGKYEDNRPTSPMSLPL